MNKSDEQKIDEYLNHMMNKSIIGCGINADDEFEIALDDGSVIEELVFVVGLLE
jgi:hypothetical protein